MLNYKRGSIALAHENVELSVCQVEWMGVKSCDIPRCDNARGDSAQLKLTARDRRKAMKMLERILFTGQEDIELTRELQVMLLLNTKAEIQVLCEREGGLESWLENRILGRLSG